MVTWNNSSSHWPSILPSEVGGWKTMTLSSRPVTTSGSASVDAGSTGNGSLLANSISISMCLCISEKQCILVSRQEQ